MAVIKNKDKLYDIRLINRNISKGMIDSEEYQKFLSTLRDNSKNAESISKEAIFGDELVRGHRKKSVPAYKSGPRVSYTRGVDRDLDEDFEDSDYDYNGDFAEEQDNEGSQTYEDEKEDE